MYVWFKGERGGKGDRFLLHVSCMSSSQEVRDFKTKLLLK